MANLEDTLTGHPVELFLAATRDALKALAEVPAWSLSAAETDRAVALAAEVAAGVAELEARVVSHAGTLDRPGAAGCRDLKRWLRQRTQVTGRCAAAKVRLAASLSGLEETRLAMARGQVHAEQADAIAAVLGDLEVDVVSHDERSRAEDFLVEHAADHDADHLRLLGREIIQRLDPDGADAREAAALEAAEQRARKQTTFTLSTGLDGLAHGRFVIPAAQAAMLRKALVALAAPKHVRAMEGAGSYDWQTPTPHRLGQAFCTYVETYPADALPEVGGLNATVIAVGDLDLLQGAVKAAQLDTGERISPIEYLRLACDAGVIPLWMDATGEHLALGRRRRFHTRQQRLASVVTQRHCQHPGCDIPAYLCHLHHSQPWSRGGPTDLANTDLLCPFHHSAAHRDDGTHPRRT